MFDRLSAQEMAVGRAATPIVGYSKHGHESAL